MILNVAGKSLVCRSVLVLLVAALVGVALFVEDACAARAKQKGFSSPEEAVTTLVSALKKNEVKEVIALFGPGGRALVLSGDRVADLRGREWFVKAFEEKNGFVKEGENRVVLQVGRDDWPLPVPLVKRGDKWFFDAGSGREEILNRRIGRNELNAIQVILAMVDAEREYALKDRDGDGLLEYAQKFTSEPAKRDGLYWDAKEGEAPSPLGSLAAKAAAEGYGSRDPKGKPQPYHGYFYRILKSQGENAPGGAFDYVVNGKMIGGFAIVAWPAKYGNSGVMTFVVNHEGEVYQKDLGPETAKIAKTMKRYNPDETWKKVQEPVAAH